MTDSRQHLRDPSPKQLRLLRRLADERGVSFAWPRSGEEADRQIKGLLKRPRTSRDDRRREAREVREAMAKRGDAASVRSNELAGYGSTATWAGGP